MARFCNALAQCSPRFSLGAPDCSVLVYHGLCVLSWPRTGACSFCCYMVCQLTEAGNLFFLCVFLLQMVNCFFHFGIFIWVQFPDCKIHPFIVYSSFQSIHCLAMGNFYLEHLTISLPLLLSFSKKTSQRLWLTVQGTESTQTGRVPVGRVNTPYSQE